MSGPQGPEPTRPQTPWWQQVRRRTPPTPSYPAEPQGPPNQQAAYPSAQPAAPQAQCSPQYPQQPGQYGYPGPYGAKPADAAAQPKHTMRWLLIAGGVLVGAIAAVLVVVGLLQFGAFDRQVLNVSKAQEGVKHVISDPVIGYGIENVTDVTCNNGKNPAAENGDSFICEVTVDGKKHQVRALFVDDNGTYEVDRPR